MKFADRTAEISGGRGFGFWISACELKKGLYSSWTVSPSLLIPAAEDLRGCDPLSLTLHSSILMVRGPCPSVCKGAEISVPPSQPDLLQVSLWWRLTPGHRQCPSRRDLSYRHLLKPEEHPFPAPTRCPLGSIYHQPNDFSNIVN